MFKEITATFKVQNDTAFNNGRWNKDRTHFVFEVKRMLSGASPYGDRSCHSCIITNVPDSFPYHFDTRYDGISTEKDKWVKFWKDWIKFTFDLVVYLDEYDEKVVEE